MNPLISAMAVWMVLGVVAGCGEEEEGDHRAPPRVWAALPVDTLWVRGGLDDPLLELPLAIVADREHVYFSDLASRRIVALSVGDGSTAWVAGGQGGGPEEFERPAALALLPGSRLAVSDTRNSRITLMNREGRIESTFRVEDPEINGLCGLADGTLVTIASSAGPGIARWLPDGQELERVDLPWPELSGATMLERQALATTLPDGGGCVVALGLGRGFGVFTDRGFESVRPYIEQVPAPEVEVRIRESGRTRTEYTSAAGATIASRGVAAAPDALYFMFDGQTEDRGRILDVYALDGTYRHSHRLDRPAALLAFSDGVLYVLSHVDAVPTLTAMRLREEA